jgi:hypothetical protein
MLNLYISLQQFSSCCVHRVPSAIPSAKCHSVNRAQNTGFIPAHLCSLNCMFSWPFLSFLFGKTKSILRTLIPRCRLLAGFVTDGFLRRDCVSAVEVQVSD